MDVKAGYKLTDVGVIPEDWEIESLGNAGHWFSGGTPSMANDLFWKGDVPWVSAKDMKVARLRDSLLHISETAIGNGTRLAPSDALLLVVRGMILAHTLPVAVATRPMAFNQDLKALVARAGIESEFILFWFQANAPRVLGITSESTHGTKRIPSDDLFSMKVALPRPAEQEAIAEALGDADALIESLEQLLAKKRQLKQGAMQELLTGKRRLPGFSGAWEVKSLGELFNVSGGLSASRDQLSTNGHCYLHYGDIHTSNKTFVDVRSEYQDIPKLDIPLTRVSPLSLLEDGDVVFVDASEDDEGTSKHVVISNSDRIPFISGLHTIVAKSKTSALDHQYRRYCFQTPAVKAQFRFLAVGTKVSGVSKGNIVKITVRFPSVPEQTAIATILSDMDADITALEAKLTKARALKQGMMRELLTGSIRLPVDAGRIPV